MADDPQTDILQRLEALAHTLHAARAVAWRTPNAANLRAETAAENSLNYLLDYLWNTMTHQQRTDADARPIRHHAHA